MKDKNEYINFLENKILEYENKQFFEKNFDVVELFKTQEKFFYEKIYEREYLLNQNSKLNQENQKLINEIIIKDSYIMYLKNCIWWKISNPLRKIWRIKKNIKEKSVKKYIDSYNVENTISEKISIIIFSDSKQEELFDIIQNIKKQKYINSFEIIVINTNKKIIKNKYKNIDIKFIDMNLDDVDSDLAYIKVLPYINGEYVVIMNKNIVIESNRWIFDALIPIVNNHSMLALIFEEKIREDIKKSCFYGDLNKKIYDIDKYETLFLPKNRNIIEDIDCNLFKRNCVIVKRRISNYYLI